MEDTLNDLNESELLTIVDAPKTAYGIVIFKVINMILNKEQGFFDAGAKICDDPIKEDFRVKLGMIINCKELLAMPEKALEILKQKTYMEG